MQVGLSIWALAQYQDSWIRLGLVLTDIEKGGAGMSCQAIVAKGDVGMSCYIAVATNCGGPFIFTRGGLRFLKNIVIYNVLRQSCLSNFLHVGHAKVFGKWPLRSISPTYPSRLPHVILAAVWC